MIWDTNDGQENYIVDKGGWYDLGTVNEKAPDRAGVYVFVSSDKDVKYVGKAGARRLRVEIQNALNRGKGYGATGFAWFATNSDDFALILENNWIQKYQPSNNKRK